MPEITEVHEAPPLAPELQSAEVLAVMRDVELLPSSGPEIQVSQLLRRASGIERAITNRMQQQANEIQAVQQFHAPYLLRLNVAQALIVGAIKALRPALPFPRKKDGSFKAKTLQFPYGSVGFEEKGGKVRKAKGPDGKDDPLSDALLDRWCVLNQTPALKVFRRVELTGDELAALRADLRESLKEDPLTMLPSDLMVEREDATAIKKLAGDEIPDGMELSPAEVVDVVTWNGLASSAVEAVEVDFLLEETVRA